MGDVTADFDRLCEGDPSREDDEEEEEAATRIGCGLGVRLEAAIAEARWCSLRSKDTDRGSSGDDADAAAAAEGEVNAEPGADADTMPRDDGGGERNDMDDGGGGVIALAPRLAADGVLGDRASKVIVRACACRPGVDGEGRAIVAAIEGLSDDART